MGWRTRRKALMRSCLALWALPPEWLKWHKQLDGGGQERIWWRWAVVTLQLLQTPCKLLHLETCRLAKLAQALGENPSLVLRLLSSLPQSQLQSQQQFGFLREKIARISCGETCIFLQPWKCLITSALRFTCASSTCKRTPSSLHLEQHTAWKVSDKSDQLVSKQSKA